MGLKLDITNKKFGKLIALSEVKERSKTGAVKWYFQCSCGNKSIHEASRVKTGQIVSCGCARKTKDIKESLLKTLFTDYKAGARDRDHTFELSFEEFKNLTQGNCYYCGIEPQLRTRKFTAYANGVDRIDSSKGYSLTNTRSCCSICNMAKSNLTDLEFEEWLLRLVKYRNGDTL